MQTSNLSILAGSAIASFWGYDVTTISFSFSGALQVIGILTVGILAGLFIDDLREKIGKKYTAWTNGYKRA